VINPEASNVQGTNIEHKIATEGNGYFYTKLHYVENRITMLRTQFGKLRLCHIIEMFIKLIM
jgi:hypothetical protein